MSQQQLQEKYVELQILEQQMKQLQEQLQHIEQQRAELHRLEGSLQDIRKTKAGTDLLVSLGPGIFAKASLKDGTKVLMNVGADTVVETDVASSQTLIQKQEEELQQVQEQFMHELQHLAEYGQGLQQDLRKLAASLKTPPQ